MMTRIPKRIDDPPQIMLWQSDELGPVALGLCLWIATDQWLFLIVGIVFVRFYRKFRDSKSDGYFLHALYWFGVVTGKGYSALNSYIRRLIP